MSQLYFYFDQTRCTSCGTCYAACKDWNMIEAPSVALRNVTIEEKGNTFSDVKVYNMSLSCNHCENPACVKACPFEAIEKKENGVVIIDKGKCQGALECIFACPYAAPKVAEHNEPKEKGFLIDHPANKCDFCYSVIMGDEKNVPPIPICVGSCPQRALDFGTLKELNKRYPDVKQVWELKDGTVANFASDKTGSDGRKLDMRTKPSILIKHKA